MRQVGTWGMKSELPRRYATRSAIEVCETDALFWPAVVQLVGTRGHDRGATCLDIHSLIAGEKDVVVFLVVVP